MLTEIKRYIPTEIVGKLKFVEKRNPKFLEECIESAFEAYWESKSC